MTQPTTDQAIAELRKRGYSDDQISFAKLDNQYKSYQGYLAENVGLQGEEDYKLVQKEFSEVAGKRSKVFADMQAKAADDPSVLHNADAFLRSILETTADVAGFIPDVSQGITNAIVGGNAESRLGSKNLSRNLQALGLGYYDSSKGPEFGFNEGEPATIGDMPPSTRPYAVAGEEMSTAAATTMGVGTLARGRTAMQLANPVRDKMVPMTLKNPLAPIENTAGFLRNSTKDMIDFAAKNPAQFRKMETSVAVLSGIGGGIAEKVAPGDPTARMIGSIAAPLSPTTLPIAAQGSYALLNKVTYGSLDKLRNAIAMKFRGREGALDAVGRKFQDAVVAQGAKPEDLAKQIDDFMKNNPQYANQQGNLSAGLATGDDTLLAIERSLIAGDSEISKEAAGQTAASIKEMKKLYSSVLKISDNNPELLREIADARINHLNFVTNLRVSKAVRKLDLMQKNLSAISSPNVNVAKQQNAQKIKKVFDDVYEDLRTTEDQLWNKIDKTIRLSGDETEAALKSLSAETDGLRGIGLPGILKKMQDVSYNSRNGLSSVSSGDLLKARSDLGKQIRVAMRGENPDRDLARRLINLQNSITNDLAKSGNSAQIRLANNATKNRYEFLELPVVQRMRKRSIGGSVNKPDLVLDDMLMGGRSQSAYQTFNDIVEAGAKGQIRSVAGYTKGTKELADPLARFYYAMANDVIGVSGKVDLDKLGSFLTKHEQGLKALGIYDNLKMPEVQAHLVKQLQESNKKLSTSYASKSMAAKIIGTGDVNTSVSKILFNSPARHKDLKSLVNLSKRKAPGVDNAKALEGIQQSFVDNLLEQSVIKYRAPGQKDGFSELISGQKMLDALAKKQGKFTLEEDLVSSGLIDKSQMSDIKAMATRAKEFEESVLKRASGATIEDIPPGSDYLTDILGRLGGATLAASSPLGQGIGHQLIVAQIGSQAGRNFLQKLPNAKLSDVMKEAMLDPVLMKNLLERPATVFAKKSRDYKLRAMLVSKGLLEEEEAFKLEGTETKTTQIKNAIAALANQGKNRGEIMAAFEKESRKEGTTIGPYMLDQVQSILDLSRQERTSIIEQFDIPRKSYTIKRRSRN
jgi:hypothetical protein